MIALFAALAVGAAAPPTALQHFGVTPLQSFGFKPLDGPIAPSPCNQPYLVASSKVAPVLYRLGDLPDADMEIAVARIGVDGCQKPLIVAYKVSR